MNGRVRLKAENDRLLEEVTQLREEMRIMDSRMASIAVQLREPVNKFPDFVHYAVQGLKVLCPSMGKVKIAQKLCRAGLHLGSTTVGRILKESPYDEPVKEAKQAGSRVTAKSPNQVWHTDLTTVPISGFRTSWLPFALPQQWPFCWWVAVAIDHYSRRVMSVTVFATRPTCRLVCTFLGRAVGCAGAAPNYIICDRDSIFDCTAFQRWARHKGIKIRYGATGRHGSIAVVERMIKTLKDEGTRRILIPMERDAIRREMVCFTAWSNEHRTHMTLAGRTPDEVYFDKRPANRTPRIEPRTAWPRQAPCARPQTLVADQPGDRFSINIAFHHKRRHLPVVTLLRAA